MKSKPLMTPFARARQDTAEYWFKEAARQANARRRAEGGEEPSECPEWLAFREMEDGSAEIKIYGRITSYAWYDDDVTASQIYQELSEIDADTIHVRLNSGGGSVFEGIAIYNLLREHEAKVIVHIDALAASIASIIALAGDEIIISEGAQYMVHKPWTIEIGNSDDFRKMADTLEKIEASMLAIYQRRTSLKKAELKSMLTEETWLTGEEAVEKGFADRLAEEEEAPAEPKSQKQQSLAEGDEPEDNEKAARKARANRLRLIECELQTT